MKKVATPINPVTAVLFALWVFRRGAAVEESPRIQISGLTFLFHDLGSSRIPHLSSGFYDRSRTINPPEASMKVILIGSCCSFLPGAMRSEMSY